MTGFLLRRILQALPVLLLVLTVTFFLIRLAKGDPFADEKAIPESAREEITRFYGLDRPLFVQYLTYLGNFVRGDLGYSYSHPDYPVTTIIANHFPATVQYALPGFLLAILGGIALGGTAAAGYRGPVDRLASGLSLTGVCLPTFVLGPLLILVAAGPGSPLPAVGWSSGVDLGTGVPPIAYRVLPALTVALFFGAYVARLTRNGLIEAYQQDFIATARAKGLSRRRIFFRHALPVSVLPLVNYLGPALAGILTGSFVIESIFNIPGLGTFFVSAATDRDYGLILGLVSFYATLIITFNIAADLLLAWLNPRIRTSLFAGRGKR